LRRLLLRFDRLNQLHYAFKTVAYAWLWQVGAEATVE
jgi:hypothetical protein